MIRKLTALAGVLIVLLMCLAVQAELVKDEVVYASLAADGQVKGLYVINAFEADAQETVTDLGDYTQAFPLGDAEDFAYENGEVSFVMQAGRFSYQGDLAGRELPWTIEISYFLDGNPVAPEALSGAAGQLEVRLTVQVNEAMRSFAEGLSLQLTVTLDGDKATGIRADKATYALAGGNRTLAYVVLPGQNADYTFTANIRDFSMPGIQAAAVRMGMDEKMYQDAAVRVMAGSPFESAVSGLMGNFIRNMQGRAPVSFTNKENSVRNVQFVMMAQGIPAPEPPVQPAPEPESQNLWDRILKLFNK